MLLFGGKGGGHTGSSLIVVAEVGTTDSTLADESFSIYICGMVCFPVRIYFLALWYPTHYVCVSVNEQTFELLEWPISVLRITLLEIGTGGPKKWPVKNLSVFVF